MGRGAWRATTHGIAKSWTQLSNLACIKNIGGFPGGSDDKESACSVRDLGLIPRWGSSPGEGNLYPLQYSCLENSMDRAAW